MKKIKSCTGIWNVEKVLYAINDFLQLLENRRVHLLCDQK